MQASLRHNLHAPVQKILHVHQQRPKCQTGSPTRQSNQQVDIALLIRDSASQRAEDADIAETVSLREGSDLGSVGLDQGVHDSYASSSSRRSASWLFMASSSACRSLGCAFVRSDDFASNSLIALAKSAAFLRVILYCLSFVIMV